MNNQFATQHLLAEMDAYDSLRSALSQLGASNEAIEMMVNAVKVGLLTPTKAIAITKATTGVNETSSVGGMVTSGPTAASVTTGDGEQYFSGTRKKVKEDAPRLAGSPAKTNKQGAKNLSAYKNFGFTKAPNAEEAGKDIKGVEVKMLWKEGEEPVWKQVEYLAKEVAKDNIPRELHREFIDYIKEKFEQNQIREPKDVYDSTSSFLEMLRENLNESRAYSQFRREASIRSKPQQMHEAAKIINKKLEEINKLLEFTRLMRSELSEGDEVIEYSTNTKKVFEKIHNRVVEVYSKLKKLG